MYYLKSGHLSKSGHFLYRSQWCPHFEVPLYTNIMGHSNVEPRPQSYPLSNFDQLLDELMWPYDMCTKEAILVWLPKSVAKLLSQQLPLMSVLVLGQQLQGETCLVQVFDRCLSLVHVAINILYSKFNFCAKAYLLYKTNVLNLVTDSLHHCY